MFEMLVIAAAIASVYFLDHGMWVESAVSICGFLGLMLSAYWWGESR